MKRTFLLALLSASLHAEEKPNQLVTALGSTTISGYVDTSAHWSSTTQPLPRGYRSYPLVYLTAPTSFQEGATDAKGQPRFLKFLVHRIGGHHTNTTVYLTFKASGDPVQASVTIPAGASHAEAHWQIPDNGMREPARRFTAAVSLDPVRLGWESARYRTAPSFNTRATVSIVDKR